MPARSAVARFAAAVLTGLAEIGEPGMPYPAQFRLRSQPLQPVIDALGHHATPPDTATTPNTATDAVTEAAVVRRWPNRSASRNRRWGQTWH